MRPLLARARHSFIATFSPSRTFENSKKMVIDSPPDPLFLLPCSRALAPAIPARISSRSTRRLVRSSFKKLPPQGHQLLACGPSLRFGPAGSPAACGGRSAYDRGEALARPPACGCNPNWKKTPAGFYRGSVRHRILLQLARLPLRSGDAPALAKSFCERSSS